MSASLIEMFAAATSLREVRSGCREMCRRHGFDHFVYTVQVPVSFVNPRWYVLSDLPARWRRHYREMAYVEVDPTVAHCAERLTPLLWEDAERLYGGARKVRKLIRDAARFGLRSGVSVPVRGVRGALGSLSLVSGDEHSSVRPRIARALADLVMLTSYLHEAFERVDRDRLVRLTRRERECLLWLTEGKTTAETSQILGVAYRTVTYHIHNAAEKLGTVSRQQAIARAVARGSISLRPIRR